MARTEGRRGTYTLLTPGGRAAVAVIGVRGATVDAITNGLFAPASDAPFRVGSIRFGHWANGESVVVTPLDGGRFEIHCHGGSAAAQQICDGLRRSGFQRRADGTADWLPARDDPFQEENVAVLCRCRTRRTAALALRQIDGALIRWLRS